MAVHRGELLPWTVLSQIKYKSGSGSGGQLFLLTNMEWEIGRKSPIFKFDMYDMMCIPLCDDNWKTLILEPYYAQFS